MHFMMVMKMPAPAYGHTQSMKHVNGLQSSQWKFNKASKQLAAKQSRLRARLSIGSQTPVMPNPSHPYSSRGEVWT